MILLGANDAFEARVALGASDALDWVSERDVVIVSTELSLPLVVAAVLRADARGARVVVSCAPYADLPSEVVDLADPLVANEQGVAALADGQMLPRSLVVTFGPAGSSWDGERAYAAVLPEYAVVASTGAGDAFCGTLAAALADGADRHTALMRANRAGAACIQRLGPRGRPPALRPGSRCPTASAPPPGAGRPTTPVSGRSAGSAPAVRRSTRCSRPVDQQARGHEPGREQDGLIRLIRVSPSTDAAEAEATSPAPSAPTG